MRTKYETLQDEYSGFVDTQSKEAEAGQAMLKTVRDTLQRQISELQRQLDTHAMNDTPRHLERLKTQLDISEKQWADENSKVRDVCGGLVL